MEKQVQEQLKLIKTLQETVQKMEGRITELEESRFKTAKREIINHDVQFMRAVYRANGTLVTQINP